VDRPRRERFGPPGYAYYLVSIRRHLEPEYDPDLVKEFYASVQSATK
jgi:hypothetical protein